MRSLKHVCFPQLNKIHNSTVEALLTATLECVSPFLAWGDFHTRSRFAHSTIPEEKWGTTCSLIPIGGCGHFQG